MKIKEKNFIINVNSNNYVLHKSKKILGYFSNLGSILKRVKKEFPEYRQYYNDFVKINLNISKTFNISNEIQREDFEWECHNGNPKK